MDRRKFIIMSSGLIISGSLIGKFFYDKTNVYRNSYANLANRDNDIEIISLIYPNSDDSVRFLKEAIQKSGLISDLEMESFREKVLIAYKEYDSKDFIKFANNRMKNDFMDLKIFTIDGWVFSDFECRLWHSFG
jgi:hypothetical protein